MTVLLGACSVGDLFVETVAPDGGAPAATNGEGADESDQPEVNDVVVPAVAIDDMQAEVSAENFSTTDITQAPMVSGASSGAEPGGAMASAMDLEAAATGAEEGMGASMPEVPVSVAVGEKTTRNNALTRPTGAGAHQVPSALGG